MSLWFSRDEFAARLSRVQPALRERGLDAMVAYEPESITWLTGFYTRAYANYAFAIAPAFGAPALACRDVSKYYAETTCAYPEASYWSDGDDLDAFTGRVIRERLGAPKRLGIEAHAWPMNAARRAAIQELLPDVELVDVGRLIGGMRLVKSPAEIEYQRKAARAAEAGMRAGAQTALVGATERDVAAAVCAAMVRAGSDAPGPGVLSSGERARHLHGGYTDRVLERGDTLQLETTPHVRHYHARFMRTIKVGGASAEERETARRLLAIQDRAYAETGPGVPATVPDRIYREGIAELGLTPRYSNKTYYSVGLMMPPSGGEPLEATPSATWRFAEGMVFHSYLLVAGFGFSETVAVTADGCERLTKFARSLIET